MSRYNTVIPFTQKSALDPVAFQRYLAEITGISVDLTHKPISLAYAISTLTREFEVPPEKYLEDFMYSCSVSLAEPFYEACVQGICLQILKRIDTLASDFDTIEFIDGVEPEAPVGSVP